MKAAHASKSAGGRGCAVLIPCLDEEHTIGSVVSDFRRVLPDARIYVFDNGSSDRTAAVAAAAGATVVASPRRGKGNVVRHMLRTVDAEVYLLVDGDATYPPDAAPAMLRLLEESGGGMVVGERLRSARPRAFRPLHRFGNRLLSRMIRVLFSAQVTDVLSGYRAFTSATARSLRLRSEGFEIETELTLQALVRDVVIREMPVEYAPRPAGSVSKLDTIADALHILKFIALIFKSYRPFPFFSGLASLCFVGGLLAGWRPVVDFVETRYVSHVPLALLAAALEILAVLFWGIALVLDAIVRFHLEALDSNDSARRTSPSAEPDRVTPPGDER
jgi:glycosyltransferase involved in cell wall biosynthesis